ncbi:DUF6126 family protein [Streptomyces sp. NPDC051662]|uniref:DUF6126 family protein n=1 Tax=Streptomyces sp. NPDC051662 TaxID=3154750 RepID=UPI003441CE81
MPESENPVPGPADGPEGRPTPAGSGHVMKEEGKFPRGLVIRLFAYLIAGHLFAAFLYLLFEMGARG